jgi:dihydrofolate synthase/folylpolyglutamate synthase
MLYQQALEYLYNNLPMFQRVGAIAYKENLDNTVALCEALGNPHKKIKSIHVAGTNGKGSSSHMLAAILQSCGYKTGLYTSPHLKEFTERIKINGSEIKKDFVVSFVERIKPSIEKIQPSFFEITVAMAFDYFAASEVDIAVIEVGLGGRLDSTNVITPLVSLITNISYDHKDILGDTLAKIASEKAGIIKRNIPVVISERQAEVEHVFMAKAKEQQAYIQFASDQYSLVENRDAFDIYKDGKVYIQELRPQLKGIYQQKNILGVIVAVEQLQKLDWKIDVLTIRKGIEQVIDLTGLKGRWQKLGDNPLIICDTGHNEAGVQEVLKQLSTQTFNRLHIVWGMVKDKDSMPVLQLLPTNASYYFCQATIPRAMDAGELARLANSIGLTGTTIPDVNQAIEAAKKNSHADDLIFIGGSTFVVAEIDGL